MRMAGQSDFVLVGKGDHAFQEIGDALPINISRDAPSTGEGRPRGRVAKSPSTVSGSASARSPAGPQDAEDAQVVLDGRDLRFGAVADEVLETLDVAVPLGALAEQDRGTFGPVDMARSQEGRREQVDADIPLSSALLEVQQFVHSRITEFFVRDFGHSTDVLDAVAGEKLESLVGGWPALGAQFHQGAFATPPRRRQYRRRRGCQRSTRPGGKKENFSIHRKKN